jgi:hypothetical protein
LDERAVNVKPIYPHILTILRLLGSSTYVNIIDEPSGPHMCCRGSGRASPAIAQACRINQQTTIGRTIRVRI